MELTAVQSAVEAIAGRFASDRRERQVRRHLDPADFQALADAGYLKIGVPALMGGLWTDLPGTARAACELLRVIARGDPSVALVASMHPAVLSFWLSQPVAPEPYEAAWHEQARQVAQTALDGHWWGTVTSEPGSGGDVGKTKALARRTSDGYSIVGHKHFGSGSGIASFMVTTAIPDGEDTADWFYMDMRGAAWDGSGGLKLTAEWDGHGMTATQSHAFELTGFPAQRLAWPGNLRVVSGVAGAFVSAVFTAVVVGAVQSAVEAARSQLGRKREEMRAYDTTEWARVEVEAWLIDQAYESMLRAVEARGSGALLDALKAKTAIAELAESATARICRVIGGGSFHRSSHFGAAFEDVRALGFLRPPWGLAFDTLLQLTWDQLDKAAQGR